MQKRLCVLKFKERYFTSVHVTLLQAMKIFHDKGVKHVVLTSLVLPGYDDLVMLASEKGTYAHRQSDTICVHTTHTYCTRQNFHR